MLLKQTQQVQPAFMQAQMQSQQAWIISQQALSPLVQVMQMPSLVIVQSHLHMAMLHVQTIMPFITPQRLHMPPAIILHIFCKVAADISSSQEQVIFIPPAHFSIFIVHRGTMQMPMPGIIAGMPAACPMDMPPDIPIEAPIVGRSSIIMLDIAELLSRGRSDRARIARFSETSATADRALEPAPLW